MTQAFIQNLKSIDHASAQGAQKAILDTALAQVGFIPNMYANMANAPAVHAFGTVVDERFAAYKVA